MSDSVKNTMIQKIETVNPDKTLIDVNGSPFERMFLRLSVGIVVGCV